MKMVKAIIEDLFDVARRRNPNVPNVKGIWDCNDGDYKNWCVEMSDGTWIKVSKNMVKDVEQHNCPADRHESEVDRIEKMY